LFHFTHALLNAMLLFYAIMFLKTTFHHLQRRQLQFYQVTRLYIVLLCALFVLTDFLQSFVFYVRNKYFHKMCDATLNFSVTWGSIGAYRLPLNIFIFCMGEVRDCDTDHYLVVEKLGTDWQWVNKHHTDFMWRHSISRN
jgi:hypothetical protein